MVNNNSAKDKPLRLEMPTPSANSSTAAPSVITATTPISTRYPSEDATLEYGAYDNQGMTPSPILPVAAGGCNGGTESGVALRGGTGAESPF